MTHLLKLQVSKEKPVKYRLWMKFWAVGGREDRDRMLSLKGSPHLISPICCSDPAEKWLLVLVSTSDPAKMPHASGVSFSNISATGSLPQRYCCSLQQMSFLWWGLRKGKERGGRWGEKWRVHLCAGAGQGWNPAAWLTFPRAWGHCSPPAGAFGSGVICTHVFLEGRISVLPVVLNRTLNSSLKGSKSPD